MDEHRWDLLATQMNRIGPPERSVEKWKRVWSIRKYHKKHQGNSFCNNLFRISLIVYIHTFWFSDQQMDVAGANVAGGYDAGCNVADDNVAGSNVTASPYVPATQDTFSSEMLRRQDIIILGLQKVETELQKTNNLLETELHKTNCLLQAITNFCKINL